MIDSNFVILYVNNPQVSARFYEDLLEKQLVEASATFAMFVLPSGMRLGLWSKHTVEPAAEGYAGNGEIVFSADSNEQVDALCSLWRDKGLEIMQEPVEMDFGYTFLALDPDGYRLRVYRLSIE
ncbi:VOC family protein [Rahnella aceris]